MPGAPTDTIGSSDTQGHPDVVAPGAAPSAVEAAGFQTAAIAGGASCMLGLTAWEAYRGANGLT